MKQNIIIALSLISLSVLAQSQDTTINRNVTVEREFQPIIQDAGKLNTQPNVVTEEIQPSDVIYSSYSVPLSTNFNINPLGCSLTSWKQPRPMNGELESSVGHSASNLDFNYKVKEGNSMELDLYANHHGQWYHRQLSETKLGFDFSHKGKGNAIFFFGVDGNHEYFTRHIDRDTVSSKQSFWTANTRIGVKSKAKETFQYLVQVGYTGFIVPDYIAEHQIRSQVKFSWTGKEHRAGANLSEQTNLYSWITNDHEGVTSHTRHAIRIEPFYEYNGKRFHLHAGVNLDMNIGKGKMMSKNENISFAPSPNVQFEYNITRNWLAFYGEAHGSLGKGSLQGYQGINRYFNIGRGVNSVHVSCYVPVDATLGFKIRPQENLLINISAGYELKKNAATMLTILEDDIMRYVYTDCQHWRVGAEFTYHYQDIVSIRLGGNYFKCYVDNMESPFTAALPTLPSGRLEHFDHPDWEAYLRVDGRIDSHWSLYLDSYFCGAKDALLYSNKDMTYSTAEMMPTINLSLGARYEYNKWLGCFAQIDNLLNRRHADYYHYVSPGIQALIGVTWKF